MFGRFMAYNCMEYTPELYRTTYNKDLLGLKAGGTSIQPKKVADFLDLSADDISKVAGVTKKSVRFDEKIPNEVKERLEQIGNICLLVAEYFKGEPQKTALWFRTPNPLLGDISPRDMIRFGRYKKLMKFVIDARNKATNEPKEPEENTAIED